jgi:hypothetical protein
MGPTVIHDHDTDDNRCDECRQWPPWWRDLADRLTHTERRLDALGEQMTNIDDNQAHLSTDVQAIAAGLTDIETEIARLKAQPTGQLDFTALDAVVARVKGDAVVPAPAPAPAPAPVVTTPVDSAPAPVVTDPAPPAPPAA